jgi:uncharacterized repeat protein (TIGR04052 family)
MISAVGACGEGTSEDGETQRELVIHFNALVGDEEARCGQLYQGVGSSELEVELRNLKWFVSKLELVNEAGEASPLTLIEEAPWQSRDAALIDLEDGAAGCSEFGNPETNSQVKVLAPEGSWSALRFEVGVPQAVNHLDLTDSAAPLNQSDMFWAWQSGHKFTRIEWLVSGEEGQIPWNFHLGSTGCMSDGATVAPAEACMKPNRAVITVEGINPEDPSVDLDLSALFSGVDLGYNTPETHPGCASMPNDSEDCAPLFESLGLSESACGEGCSAPFKATAQ